MRKCSLWIAAALCAGLPIHAQNVSGSISGTVNDGLRAAIAGADIKLTNAQGFVRTTKSNTSGFFSFPDLTAATFTLSINAPGFKTYLQRDIEVGSGAQRSLGVITLQVGEVTESVTVTAEAATVQLGSSEKAGVLTTEDMETMALRGRDFMDAVGLLAGVVDTADSRDAPAPDSIGSIYILGGRANSKNMTVDGVTTLDTGSNGGVHSMPSMDSVGEIRVLMSNYAAEHGRNSGGTITVITKGGGKQFHGTAGWYYRHESFSANNFFNNRNNVGRPPYRYNIFSYTLAGPVYIPGKFNNDRNKLFFFWSHEFQRQKITSPARTVRVPTALERQGDFSQSFDVNGRLITVYDPDAGRKAFPGNVIPASRFHPVGQKVLALFPLPNFVDPVESRRHQWNYISQISHPFPRQTEVVRVDYSPRANVMLYFRGTHNTDEDKPMYGSWVTGNVNFPLTATVFRRPGRGGTIHGTVTLSPTVFGETVFGISQNKLFYFPEDEQAVSRKTTGIDIPQWYPGQNPNGLIPNMTFGGVPNYANPSMSNGSPYYNSNTIFSLVQNVSWIKGTHMVKFGMYLERTRKDQSASVATRGSVDFGRNNNSPVDANYAYANALLGNYNSYSEATARPQGQYRFTNLEWYAQDAWRIRPRLLLDFGVRFYHDMPQYDARHQLNSFNASLWDPAKAPVLLAPALVNGKKVALDPLTGKAYNQGLIGTFVPGVGNPSNGMVTGGVTSGVPEGMYAIPAVMLAPRLGFSWDPLGTGRMAIRGGGGVFYDRPQGNPTMNLLGTPPTIFTPTVYYGSLNGLAATAGSGVLAPSTISHSLLGSVKASTVYNYSFGIQRQFGSRMIVDVSYAGALGRHLLWKRSINPIPWGSNWMDVHPENADPSVKNRALPGNFLRPFQGYGDIQQYEFASTSNYNSLQVSANRRMNRGFLFGVAYTFSKALGTASTDTETVSPFFNPRHRNYGPLSFDRSHVLSVRSTWTLPKPGKILGHRALGMFSDGWELSGIYRLQSGPPFTPGISLIDYVDVTGTGSEGPRPNIIDPAAPREQRFGRPERGDPGNAGEGVLRRPGLNNWDLSLYRVIRFAERKTLQLRFETYNTFNHTQFQGLDQTARFQGPVQANPMFLQPTSARSPRRIQFAARLNF